MKHDEPTTDETVRNPAALLAKNKELLSELAQTKAALQTATESIDAVKGEATKWRKQWHDVAVIAPLDAALESASAGPVRYLRSELLERGFLKLEADAQGIERPTWFVNGKPVEPGQDLWKFLCDFKDPTLNRMLRGSGTTGSGASNSRTVTPQTPTPPAPAAPVPMLGLR